MRRGETLTSIARRYGTTEARLRAWTKVGPKPKIGTVLKVRQASTQTVLTTENGDRRILRRKDDEPKIVHAVLRRQEAAADATVDEAAKRPAATQAAKPDGAKRSKSRAKTAVKQQAPVAPKVAPPTAKRVNKRT